MQTWIDEISKTWHNRTPVDFYFIWKYVFFFLRLDHLFSSVSVIVPKLSWTFGLYSLQFLFSHLHYYIFVLPKKRKKITDRGKTSHTLKCCFSKRKIEEIMKTQRVIFFEEYGRDATSLISDQILLRFSLYNNINGFYDRFWCTALKDGIMWRMRMFACTF